MHRACPKPTSLWLFLCALLLIGAGVGQPVTYAETEADSPLANAFQRAADEFGVPRDLLVATAFTLSRLDVPAGEPSIDHGFGIMHLVDNPTTHTLQLASQLLGVPSATLKTDTAQNIRGGAALLASYADEQGLTGAARNDATQWYEVIARYSNAENPSVAQIFADDVYGWLAKGISTTAGQGEQISVPAQNMTPNKGKYADMVRAMALAPDYSIANSIWEPAYHGYTSGGTQINYQIANRGVGSVKYIIIHTMQGYYATSLNWFQNPKAGVSAHYSIRSSDGQVAQSVREKDIAYHAGNWTYNTQSIGIEHEGWIEKPQIWYTEAMYRSSAALACHIARKYSIPIDRQHILGHNEVPGATHTDPGSGWNWTYYMQLVRNACTTSSTSTPVLSATRIRDTTIEVGETLAVEFTVTNPTSATYQTQAPDGGQPETPSTGWVYDEAECFLGNSSRSYPAYDKVTGRLRVTLGFADGTTGVAQSCIDGSLAGSGWRWGLGTPLQPNETRKIVGYVRFRTPGQYQLKATLNNENIKEYGSDGNGMDVNVGTVTVSPERRAPEVSAFDGNITPQASVYQLAPVPDSLLARTANPLSAVEGTRIGSFAWLGSGQNWGLSGPLGQSDRFVIRQVRAFYVPADGVYEFRLTNDDGGWLWIDGSEIVKNIGLHPVTSADGSVFLAKGFHTVAVKFFESSGEAYAGYTWRRPGETSFSEIPIPLGAERIGAKFKLGLQLVVTADDLGGSGLQALDLWINETQQPSSNKPVALELGAGSHSVRYRARDQADAGGNVSETTTVRYLVDPNLQIHYSFLPVAAR